MRRMLAKALDSAMDYRTWCQYDARDYPLSQLRFNSAWAFLLAVRECNLAGGVDCVEEWAYTTNMTSYNNQQITSNNDKKTTL
jgi:hypothetical protein